MATTTTRQTAPRSQRLARSEGPRRTAGRPPRRPSAPPLAATPPTRPRSAAACSRPVSRSACGRPVGGRRRRAVGRRPAAPAAARVALAARGLALVRRAAARDRRRSGAHSRAPAGSCARGSSRAGARRRASRRRRARRCARPCRVVRRSSCSSTGTGSSRSPAARQTRARPRACAPSSPASVSGSPTTTRSALALGTSRGDRGQPAARVRPLDRGERRGQRARTDRETAQPQRAAPWSSASDRGSCQSAALDRRARGRQRLGQLLGVAAAGLRHRVAAASAAARDLRPPRAPRRRP